MSLSVEQLRFAYGSRPVLQDISFRAEQGEFLSVLAPNGVGKSTLFQCLLGLLTPQAGVVAVDGRNVQDMTAARPISPSVRPVAGHSSSTATGKNTVAPICARASGTTVSPVITITGRKKRHRRIRKNI